MGPLVAAGIQVGTQLLGNVMNNAAVGKSDAATRNFNQNMYWIQRGENLKDWNMQNDYNSPAAQMQRFKDAGLNPNLIYGQSSEAAPVKSTNAPEWQATPKQYDFGRAAAAGISAYQDAAIQDAQLKTMEVQRSNLELDAKLKVMDIAGSEIRNAKSSLDLRQSTELYDTAVAEVKEHLRGMQLGNDIKISQEVRDAAMHAPSLLEAFQRVAKTAVDTKVAEQQISNLRKTGQLQDLEIGMRKLGLSYNDGVVLRMLAQFAQGQSLPEVVKNLWSKLQSAGSALSNWATPGKDDVQVK